MKEYIIKIHNHYSNNTRSINVSTCDFLQSYYDGFAYDLANMLTELYMKHKNSTLVIKVQNVKKEPISVSILNGVRIFKNRCN